MDVIKKVYSKENNEIRLISLNQANFDKTILLIGVFHGDEPQGEYLINRFLKENVETVTKNRLLFIPCLNPDGKAKNTRQNSNFIDLNRNFDTKNWVKSQMNDFWGGEYANSEIETRFVTQIIDLYAPDTLITFHAPYKVVNYDGPAKELASKISELTGYPVQENIGYPTLGSFGTYCGVERQIPTITLELDENEDETSLWQRTKEMFKYFADEY